jgi:hypothetical protein
MLDRKRMVAEVYDLRHKHDNDPNQGHRYEDDLLTRTVSPALFRSANVNWFVLQLQGLMVLLVDQTQELRNLFNYNVDRYYDRHPN